MAMTLQIFTGFFKSELAEISAMDWAKIPFIRNFDPLKPLQRCIIEEVVKNNIFHFTIH